MQVSGKTALVTGAGSGLGRSIALALAEAGADVAVTELASRMENARTVAASIRSMGRKALVVKLDVTSVKNIERAVAEVMKGLLKNRYSRKQRRHQYSQASARCHRR